MEINSEIQKVVNSTETGKTKKSVIGRHKYDFLKSQNYDLLSDFEKNQIKDFENNNFLLSQEQIDKNKKYLQDCLEPKKENEFSITAKELWLKFKIDFKILNNKDFEKTENSIKNIEPLIYYFSKDERFFDCENLKKEISIPSFDKGLLIIGDFGNGKTSTMKVFEKIFKGSQFGFKGYSANEVVSMFEKCSNELSREDFYKSMWRGTRYFDDLKTERIASNFGKVNIFKEIIEERYIRKLKTFVTCNYKKDYPNDINAALDEFEEKYEGAVYDRLFEMFNIIEFDGKSFRK